MHLEIAIEQLVKRIQQVEAMPERDAKRIAGYLIITLILEPGKTSNQTIKKIIELDKEIEKLA